MTRLVYVRSRSVPVSFSLSPAPSPLGPQRSSFSPPLCLPSLSSSQLPSRSGSCTMWTCPVWGRRAPGLFPVAGLFSPRPRALSLSTDFGLSDGVGLGGGPQEGAPESRVLRPDPGFVPTPRGTLLSVVRLGGGHDLRGPDFLCCKGGAVAGLVPGSPWAPLDFLPLPPTPGLVRWLRRGGKLPFPLGHRLSGCPAPGGRRSPLCLPTFGTFFVCVFSPLFWVSTELSNH